MARRKWQTLPADVEEARAELELWRKDQRKGARLPADLWEKAVRLARAHGVNPIARTLRLNYDALKSRLAGGERTRRKSSASASTPTFVEVGVETPLESAGCVIELEDRRGQTLRIRLARTNDLDLVNLAKALWQRRR